MWGGIFAVCVVSCFFLGESRICKRNRDSWQIYIFLKEASWRRHGHKPKDNSGRLMLLFEGQSLHQLLVENKHSPISDK